MKRYSCWKIIYDDGSFIAIATGIYCAEHASELLIADDYVPEGDDHGNCDQYDKVRWYSWGIALIESDKIFFYIFLKIEEHRYENANS